MATVASRKRRSRPASLAARRSNNGRSAMTAVTASRDSMSDGHLVAVSVARLTATPAAVAMATRGPSCLRARRYIFYSAQKLRAAARVGLQAKRRRGSRNKPCSALLLHGVTNQIQRRFALLQPFENVAPAACVVKLRDLPVHMPCPPF